ncbi:hypothetical protein PR048_015460 [Dryococelus australis]|uniref:Uncharacterized protein n=1 Tax=Dryococelus australis TaxID=614101 RepID=A0ABQ9HH11_9NEOP|nr:hypothetical protein PR048_015460 [Dryococelus australis]
MNVSSASELSCAINLSMSSEDCCSFLPSETVIPELYQRVQSRVMECFVGVEHVRLLICGPHMHVMILFHSLLILWTTILIIDHCDYKLCHFH